MRTFTPETARATLRSLRGPAELMTRAYRSLEALGPGGAQPDRPVDRDYFRLARALLGAMDRLRREGVLVKDARSGLLDFPASRAGRIVMLCWKVGEAGLDHWHEAEAGFAGRQPVDDDGPWEEPGAAEVA